MKALFQKLKDSGFFTLVAGTGIAQVLPIAFAPILTRLYTPEDFGVVAFYLSLASILGVLATFRFEMAILQPKEDQEAYDLLRLSILLALLVSLGIAAILFLWFESITKLLGAESVGYMLYLIPVSVFLSAVFRTCNYWLVRSGKYQTIAAANTVQAASTPGAQISLAHSVSLIGGGLVFGNVVGQFFSSFLMYSKSSRQCKAKNLGHLTKGAGLNLARRYRRMPLYALPGAFLDTAAIQLPVFFMTKYFSGSSVGYFSLVFRILSIPARLVSGVLSQLLLKTFSKIANGETTDVRANDLLLKSVFGLSVLILPMVLVVLFWGAEIFAFVFGEPWRAAGEMASVLVFAVAIRFVVSPLSAVLALSQNLRMGTAWQFLYFLTLASVLYLAASLSISDFLLVFVLHEVVLYSIYLLIIAYACNRLDQGVL